MSIPMFLAACLAVAGLGAILIAVALVIGRRRRAVERPVEVIEDLSGQVNALPLNIPAAFGPRPFDEAQTQLRPRMARGTTNPPPIPVDRSSTRIRPERPSRAGEDIDRKPTTPS